jgi:hypothetical protein
MKRIFYLLFLGISLVSCDFIMKPRNKEPEAKPEGNIVLGNDKDEKGCVISAGYKWSVLKNECIRVFDEGYRLNAINELKDEGTTSSAFVVFDESKEKAELFLPDNPKSVILEKEKTGVYKNKGWLLEVNKKYTLKKFGQAVYAGAQIEENRVTGTDIPEED